MGKKLKDYQGGANFTSIDEIVTDVFHMNYPTQHALCSTFIRFSEYRESPPFRGKPFTLEEYMDWNASQNKEFDYFQEVEGFNIPSSSLTPFYDGRFDPLSQKEKELLELFEDKENFYIIGTHGKKIDKDVLIHEVAHGLYFTNRAYRREARRIIQKIPSRERKQINKFLKKTLYHPAVWEDETQAYMLYTPELRENGIKTKRLRPISAKLMKLFRKYCPDI